MRGGSTSDREQVHGAQKSDRQFQSNRPDKARLDSPLSVSNVPCFMKHLFISFLAAGLCGTLLAADPSPAPFKDSRDKTSYSLGVNIGNSMKAQGADMNPEEVANGMRDALSGKAKLTEQEVRETLMAWQQEIRGKRAEKMKVEGEQNKKAGEEFLAANAKKPGVKTTPSGLQYKVITAGKGPQPKPEDTVSAHYKGTLIDGTEFDSSYTRGKPLTIPVRGVVAGWQEALTNMHVGDKWELYIPGHLAYGERGSPPKIGANATLVFEMELLGIEPPQPNATSAFPSPNAAPGGSPQIRVQPGATPGGVNAGPRLQVQPAPAAPKPQPAK
jgi:FKBP-type peptidyl-prolyl cis-trans isomerase FklB